MLKRRTKILSLCLAFVLAVFNGIWLPPSTVNAEQQTSSQENILKLNMDATGYLTPTAESQNMLESLENQKFSWDNATVYFVLTDRFLNSDTSNDHSYGRGLDQNGNAIAGLDTYKNPGTFHGGDLNGLTKKVNEGYFTNLGVNAIWITAPYEQIHGYTSANVKSNNANSYPDPDRQGFPYYSYHGYWTLDYTNIDANMGTEKDFENFVDSCHAKGIRVVMDVVMNHVGYTTMQDAVDYGFAAALKGDWQTYYYGNSTYLMGGEPESLNYWNKTSSAWANWWGPGFVRADYPGYTAAGGDDKHMSLSGLPDVITESEAKEVPTPPLLVNKWKKESRYNEEQKELDDFFAKTGYKKQPRYYIIKWLTDWVREYGVDGFRCDTAKHVDLDAWKDLKTEADKALKEWRKNNPDKPGAQWTDNFWMTGEAWGHGMGESEYYVNGGFDSMINFQFNKDGNPAGMENTYSSYAAAINSKPDFNVLSYISSHDDGQYNTAGVWSATDEHNMDLGTCLLLVPGGVQIYYGNEVNRGLGWNDFFTGNDYLDQRYRTDMDWNNLNTTVLTHWQKIGQFRNKHISVGAGQHEKLSDSPYTFSRTYNLEEEDEDKVVVSLPGKAGNYTINVGSIFEDGETITDAYSGQQYVVNGGSVSVTCDNHGVILLEGSGIVKPSVSAKAANGDNYKSDILDVTLKANKVINAAYSINGGTAKSYETGDVIKIGGDTAYNEKTTIVLTGISEEDQSTVTKTVTFKRSSEPIVSDGLSVQVSKEEFPTAPNIYVYDNETSKTALNGIWPGGMMEDNDDSWIYSYKGEVESAMFILSQGTWRSTPEQAPGITFTSGVEYSKATGEITETPTGIPGRVNINYKDDSGNIIKSIYRVGVVGKPYKTYASDIENYTLTGTPSNATGTFAETPITVDYIYTNGESVTKRLQPEFKDSSVTYTYDGTEQKPEVLVKNGSTVLTPNTDYELSYQNNINASSTDYVPTVTVTGKGQYVNAEKQTLTFTIQPKDLTAAGVMVLGIAQSYTYTGKAIEPKITVTDTDAKITADDYTISYKDNIEAGSAATVTITGKGNYTGTVSKNFKIIKENIPPNAPQTKMGVSVEFGTLSAVALPENWSWSEDDKNKKIQLDKSFTATAVYTGNDRDNYEELTVQVIVTGINCEHKDETKREIRNKINSTCTETGYSGDTYCTVCQTKLSDGERLKAVGHKWNEKPAVDKAATCAEAGSQSIHCSVCNAVKEGSTEVVPALGHTGGIATCSERATCNRCHEKYGEYNSRKHLHIVVKNDVAATCTKTGYSGEYYCSDCNTQIAAGESTPVIAHTWDAGKVTKQATATTDGVKTYTCMVCGGTKTEVVKASDGTTTGKPAAVTIQTGQTIKKGSNVTDLDTEAIFRVTKATGSRKTVEYLLSFSDDTKVVVPEEIVINDTTYEVTAVANNAFNNNKKVKQVIIGKNVTTIGKNAFSNCTKLEQVAMDTKLTAISDKAFYKCTKLKAITIPSKVNKIGKQAFYGCKNLRNITIRTTKLTSKKVGSKAFKGIYSKAIITVPKSKYKAYKTLLKTKGVSTKVTYKKK